MAGHGVEATGEATHRYSCPRPVLKREAVPAFAEAKPKVEEAWRFEKARKLAEEEAEKVAAEARKSKGDADRVLKDGSPHSGKVFRFRCPLRIMQWRCGQPTHKMQS